MLLGHDTPRGERAPVPNAVDMIDDGNRGIALTQEIPVQRMGNAALDRPARRDERLRSDQAAENPRPTVVRTESTEEIAI